MPPARNFPPGKVIPGASRTARDYHCPLPENKLMVDSSLFRVALLTVMFLAEGYPTRPAGKLN
jgi:hypothetical protein